MIRLPGDAPQSIQQPGLAEHFPLACLGARRSFDANRVAQFVEVDCVGVGTGDEPRSLFVAGPGFEVDQRF